MLSVSNSFYYRLYKLTVSHMLNYVFEQVQFFPTNSDAVIWQFYSLTSAGGKSAPLGFRQVFMMCKTMFLVYEARLR